MPSSILTGYIPIFLFMALAFAFPLVTLFVAKLIRPSSGGEGKLMPYECGVDPDSDARQRYAIRYYVVAILFVIFDVETIFLFPWAIIYRQLALFGLIEMLVFLGILVVGYIWIIKKGALDWA
jgi:NADH-quinone oxidoreductase subunit A